MQQQFPDLNSVIKKYPLSTANLAKLAGCSKQYINRLTRGGMVVVKSLKQKKYTYAKDPLLVEGEHYFAFLDNHYYKKKVVRIIKKFRGK